MASYFITGAIIGILMLAISGVIRLEDENKIALRVAQVGFGTAILGPIVILIAGIYWLYILPYKKTPKNG